MANDPRRYRVIEVTRRAPGIYWLSIDGQMWSEVEWSAAKRTWCIQDAAGHCLAHCDHIHGEEIDRETAIRLAKQMIVDGRMPSPETARAASQNQEQQRELGEPWEPLQDREPIPAIKDRPAEGR